MAMYCAKGVEPTGTVGEYLQVAFSGAPEVFCVCMLILALAVPDASATGGMLPFTRAPLQYGGWQMPLMHDKLPLHWALVEHGGPTPNEIWHTGVSVPVPASWHWA